MLPEEKLQLTNNEIWCVKHLDIAYFVFLKENAKKSKKFQKKLAIYETLWYYI